MVGHGHGHPGHLGHRPDRLETSTGYGSAGQTVPFNYLVTDTGTTTLTGVSVSDTVVPSVSCPSTTLAPGASETCTGSYTVTSGAVDAGSLTSTATASGTGSPWSGSEFVPVLGEGFRSGLRPADVHQRRFGDGDGRDASRVSR